MGWSTNCKTLLHLASFSLESHFSAQVEESTNSAAELAVVVTDTAFVGIACARDKNIFVEHIPDTAKPVKIGW